MAASGIVRLVACGSVDDGKSTLIGRLLHDSDAVPADTLAALEADEAGDPDLSRLLDGLGAEREQGITIDVAWRSFDIGERRFILADAPGHEQYTRNMVTAASAADVAVVLLDATRGLLTQTRRHTRLLALLGVRRVFLAVNKMDRVDWSRETFDRLAGEWLAFAAELGLSDIAAVPISARGGDNVVARSVHMAWFEGPTLVDWLAATPAPAQAAGPFRMAVQSVIRHGAGYRGLAGRVAGGTVRPGDRLRILPAGTEAAVARIVTFDGDLPRAATGQSISLVLDRAVDVSRGDVLAAPDAPLDVADQFEADIVWMSEHALLPGRSYWLQLATQTVAARIGDVRRRIDIDTGEARPARTFALNDLGVATLSLDAPIPFAPYAESREFGGFILIDRITDETVGAGMIRFALRRAATVRPQRLSVDRDQRAALKGQKPLVVWFTGLSGAGKSTIANLVDQRLLADGLHAVMLDGDNVRRGLNRDLGFTEADRVENIRRVAEVARLMTDAGLIVLVAFISPFEAERQAAREIMAPGEFLEVHVDAPLAVVEARDVKGLYARARAGELANFTGIASPYEPPTSPDLRIDTSACTPAQAAEEVMRLIRSALAD
ncbi:adenylyl-sulfate kinase [Brevundimonas viscosa]|uniref:Adenylyl-sulfate kinase n=1 Tax=Brevundimonas viscosa TaxID=871741 RepID=A0A1I6TC70_9CAUL|nr:adenylyl-sulfate kinase [Brevundimonas viscosa]SFS86718.1 adenylylsulfate kinase /sulfate adenylyltransferase subunit 1 [Brevundimonas viscosa]